MTDVLLAYIAVAFTAYAGLECWRANRYRNHTEESWREAHELAEDQIEARLLGLERELLKATRPLGLRLQEAQKKVVAGGERENHRADDDNTDSDSQLVHDLMVVASSEGAALR